MEVCVCLATRAGGLVRKEELISEVWPSLFVTDDVLTRAVSELRKVLEDDPKRPSFIETVPKRGYRLIAPVSVEQAAIDAPRSQVLLGSPQIDQTHLPRKPRWPLISTLVAGAIATLVLVAVGVRHNDHEPQPMAGRMDKKLKVVPLVTYAEGQQWLPAFSPDGSRVAYSWSVGDELDFGWYLEVKVLGSETRLRLTNQAAASPPGPAWSPDGREIAFARTSPLEDRGIFIISALGGPERKLRSLAPWGVALQRAVSWSPDGLWIAFSDAITLSADTKHKGAGPNAIYLISPTSFETRQLTTPAANELGDAAPAFSPDGKTIAFIHTNAEYRDEVCTVPTQGGTPRTLVTTGLWTNGLAWTVDGKAIVYDRSYVGGFSLWTISSSGGEPHQVDLPASRANTLQPALWHNWLAYEAHEQLGTVGRVPLDKSFTERPQTPVASTRYDHAGQYSPAGDRIAFLTDRTGTDELWVADANGSNPRQLTHLGVRLFEISWAPDGSAIAVSTVPGRVYLVPLERGGPRLIFDGPINSSDIDPQTIAFSRDGQSVYVMNHPGERYELLKVPVDGGAPVKFLDGLIEKFVESPDGHTLFFSRPKTSELPGAPGIWKSPVEGGVEQYVMPAPSRLWGLGSDGIYLVNYSTSSIDRHNFSGKRLQTVAKLGKFALGNRINISSDGRWAVFDYNQHNTVEIEMVQDFK